MKTVSGIEKPVRLLLRGILFYCAVRFALPVLFPLGCGLGIAAMVQRPASLLSARIPRLSRKTCCLLLTAAALLTAGMLLLAVGCSLLDGAAAFCPAIPQRLALTRERLRQLASRPGSTTSWGRFVGFLAAGAEWCVNFFAENYRHYLPSVLGRSTGLLAGLPSLLTAILFTVLAAFLSCGDFPAIRRAVRAALPEEIADSAALAVRSLSRTVSLLLRTYGTLMLITLGELTVGFGLLRLMGFRTGNVLTTALLISLIDALPVLGTGTVLIPWGLFELLTGDRLLGALLLAIFAVVGLMRNYWEPKLLAGRMELPPFFTLAGIYAGGKLLGAAGVILLPLLMLTAKEYRAARNKNAAGSAARGKQNHTEG